MVIEIIIEDAIRNVKDLLNCKLRPFGMVVESNEQGKPKWIKSDLSYCIIL